MKKGIIEKTAKEMKMEMAKKQIITKAKMTKQIKMEMPKKMKLGARGFLASPN